MAKAYGAACTPEFFVFDNASKKGAGGSGFVLAYHGQYDDARPKNNVQPTGALGTFQVACLCAATAYVPLASLADYQVFWS